MGTKWKSGFQAEAVIAEIERHRPANKETSSFFIYLEVAPLLLAGIDFAGDLVEHEKQAILNALVKTLAEPSTPITAGELIRDISRRTSEYLRTPLRSYTLLTDWSLKCARRQQRSIRNSTLQIGVRVPPRLERLREEAIRSLSERHLKVAAKPASCRVSLVVEARNTQAAFSVAFDNLDIVRGVRNFVIRQDTFRFRSGLFKPRPMSPILAGPLHLVAGTSRDDERVFFETDFPDTHKLANWTDTANTLETKCLRRIKQSHHRSKLEEIMLRYSRAMDKSDPNSRFLELWGLLEVLTGADNPSISYDRAVTRAAFPGESTAYDRLILTYLKDHRNDVAHRGGQSELRETHATQLKRYVERLINFILKYCGEFEEWVDLLGVLDGPTDLRRLNVRKRSLAVAENFTKGRVS